MKGEFRDYLEREVNAKAVKLIKIIVHVTNEAINAHPAKKVKESL